MKNKSLLIINLLRYFFYFATVITAFALVISILIFFSQLLNINLGSLHKIKINVTTPFGQINDIQKLDKKTILLTTAYSIIIASLLIKIFTMVLKLLKNLQTETIFTKATSQLLFKISSFLFYLSIISIIIVFIGNLLMGKLEVSLDFNSIYFQLLVASGITYVIATLYNNAVRLQTENDLTI